jgi:hypothetical protein
MVKTVFLGNPGGRRKLGRPRLRRVVWRITWKHWQWGDGGKGQKIVKNGLSV